MKHLLTLLLFISTSVMANPEFFEAKVVTNESASEKEEGVQFINQFSLTFLPKTSSGPQWCSLKNINILNKCDEKGGLFKEGIYVDSEYDSSDTGLNCKMTNILPDRYEIKVTQKVGLRDSEFKFLFAGNNLLLDFNGYYSWLDPKTNKYEKTYFVPIDTKKYPLRIPTKCNSLIIQNDLRKWE
jgi:hypothetical protein